MKLAGGCLCGAVRYVFNGTTGAAGWCHCRMCQRSSGAPAQTYVLLPAGGFGYVAGTPALHRSSANGERRFCAACGSQLESGDPRESETISLNSGTLDDPSLTPPDRHIWTSRKVPWFQYASRRTRFDDDGGHGGKVDQRTISHR